MSISPEVIDALIAAGVTAEQLAAAIKADLAIQERKEADKREKAAERQRRCRLSRMSREVTVTHSDSCDTPLPPLVPPSSPCTPSNPPIIPPSPRLATTSRGSRLAIAELPAEWKSAAIELGHRNPVGEFDRFRDYWVSQPGQKGVKTDWLATWRNWCRRSCEGQTAQRKFRQ